MKRLSNSLSYLWLILPFLTTGCRSLSEKAALREDSLPTICKTLSPLNSAFTLTAPASVQAGESLELSLALADSSPIPEGIWVELGAILQVENDAGSKSLRFNCKASRSEQQLACKSQLPIPSNFGGSYQLRGFVLVQKLAFGFPQILCAGEASPAQSLTVANEASQIDIQGPQIESVKVKKDTYCLGEEASWIVTARDKSGIDLSFVDGHLTRPGAQNYLGFPKRELKALGEDRYEVPFPLTGLTEGSYRIQFVQIADKMGNDSTYRPTDSEAEVQVKLVPCP